MTHFTAAPASLLLQAAPADTQLAMGRPGSVVNQFERLNNKKLEWLYKLVGERGG